VLIRNSDWLKSLSLHVLVIPYAHVDLLMNSDHRTQTRSVCTYFTGFIATVGLYDIYVTVLPADLAELIHSC